MGSRVRVGAGHGVLTFTVAAFLLLAHRLCSWVLRDVAPWHASGPSWRDLPADVAITVLAGVVLAGCAAWLGLVTALAAVEAATGRASALVRLATPVVVRRLVAATLGLAVSGAGVATGAVASEGPCAEPHSAPCPGSVSGLPLPDRAVDTVLAHAGLYVVEPGDSLWRIAAERLPAAAPTADVTAGWRRIYRLNRERVGADPDVLAAGARLRLPALASPSRPGRPDGGPTRKDKS